MKLRGPPTGWDTHMALGREDRSELCRFYHVVGHKIIVRRPPLVVKTNFLVLQQHILSLDSTVLPRDDGFCK